MPGKPTAPRPNSYRDQVTRWLAEDVGTGDVTSESTIPRNHMSRAVVRAKQDLVLSGIVIAREVFRQADRSVRFTHVAADAEAVESGTVLLEAEGRTRSLLTAERTALNILQHLSGIATQTAQFVEKTKGTNARILDTRKTTPGLRALEKYAVACGGGTNHRIGLFDMVLIKDNHIAAAGSIDAAVQAVVATGVLPPAIQVEVANLTQLDEALAAGAGMILLDNMTPSMMARAVKKNRGRALLEASGNVTLKRVAAIARTGVDRISVGALTHSAAAADIHMIIEELT